MRRSRPVVLPSGSVAAAATTSSYVAMPVSQRLLDTRLTAPLGAGASVSVSVTGNAPLPVPGTVVAAVLNVTVTGPAGAGYWTVWPHTSARPEASNLNIDELQSLAGGAVPNLVTVPVGTDGVVDVYTSAGGNVIVDLLGYYTPADTATAGRFQALPAPTRVMDTRNVAPFKPGEARNFTVPGAAGASAIAVNLTAITGNPGYWQAYPQGTPAPATSNLNSPPGIFAIAANQAIVTVDAGRWHHDLLRGGRRSAHRPRRHLHRTRGAGRHERAVRADDLADAHRRHPGARTQPARRTDPGAARTGASRFPSQPSRRSADPTCQPSCSNATTADTLTTGFITVGTAGATDPKVNPTTSTMNIVAPGPDEGEPRHRAGVEPRVLDVHRGGRQPARRPRRLLHRHVGGGTVRRADQRPRGGVHGPDGRASPRRPSVRSSTGRRGPQSLRCRTGSPRSGSGTPPPTGRTGSPRSRR